MRKFSPRPLSLSVIKAKFHGSSFLVANVARKSPTCYENAVRVRHVMRVLLGYYMEVTDLSRVSSVSLTRYEDVMRIRGSYEETVPVEFSLYGGVGER